MQLAHVDIARRLALLLDVALEEVRRMPGHGERMERISTLIEASRNGLVRLAATLPEAPRDVAAGTTPPPVLNLELANSNIIPFPRARRAQG